MSAAPTSPPLLARLCARGVRAALAGIAVFWGVAIVWIRGAGGVAAWWLPLALAIGALAPAPMLAPWSSYRSRRVLAFAAAILVLAVAIVGHGAIATPSRHWDGAASFDAKVFWLARATTLQQPFFADPAVFHHSPDYPLLLPLLVAATDRLAGAGAGRLWLPAFYVLWIGVLATTLRRLPGGPRRTFLVVVGAALTPALLGPGGGAVDSGYADATLLLATTTIAAGLLLSSPWEVALGVLLAIAAKPEGSIYAGVAAAAAFVAGRRRELVAAVGAGAVALAVWLPTQRLLLHRGGGDDGVSVAILVATSAGLLAMAAGVDAWLGRTMHPARWRGVACAVGAIAIAATLPWWRTLVPLGSGIGIYVHGGAWQRGFANVPAFLLACVDQALLRGHFGATFVALVSVAVWGRRAAVSGGGGGVFVAVGLAATALPFLLSPEPDLQHHLRSSLPRLLLHWLGPAWLWVGWRLGGGWPPAAEPAAVRSGMRDA